MATKKLTDLDYAAALTKTDLLHVNQSLIDKKDSLDSISDFIIRSSDQGFTSENVVANLDLTSVTITNQFKQYLFDTTAGSLNFTLPFAGGSAPSGACVMVVNDTGANNVVVEYQSGVTITLPPEGYCFIYFEGTHWELADNNVYRMLTSFLQLGGSAGVKLKGTPTDLSIRNAADSAYLDLFLQKIISTLGYEIDYLSSWAAIKAETGGIEILSNAVESGGTYTRKYANSAFRIKHEAVTNHLIYIDAAIDGIAGSAITWVNIATLDCTTGNVAIAKNLDVSGDTILNTLDIIDSGGFHGWGSTANATISDFHAVNDRSQSGFAQNGTTNEPISGVNYAYLHILGNTTDNGVTFAIAQQTGRIFVESLSGGTWHGWHELARLSGFTMAGDITMGGHNISDVGSLGSVTSLTMAGNLSMGSNKVTGLSPGSLPTDAVNKNQLDAKLDILGGTLTGTLTSRDINIQSTYFLKHNNINLMGYNVDNGGTHELVPRPIRSMILFKVVGSTETGSTLAHGLTNPVTNNKIMGIIGGYDSGTLFAGIGPGGTSAFPISVEIDDTNCYIYRSVSGSTPNAWIIVFYQD